MRHVEAGHTYLAKAMTTFMESDSKTNDEKGTHAIYLAALTHHHFGNPDHPDRPHHHDHPDYRHHPHHPDSH